MDIDARLTELGITLPEVSAPAANYVPFVRVGSLLHVSGQVAMRDGAMLTGRLGETMDVAEGAAAARACALSLLAQVRAACDGDWSRFRRVVKLTGFVNSTPGLRRSAQGHQRLPPTSSSRCWARPAATPAPRSARAPCRSASPSRSKASSSSHDAPCPPVSCGIRVAHRGLHGPGAPENSLAAVRAAVAAGYGIEIDVQPSADGQAMVFHDDDAGPDDGRAGPGPRPDRRAIWAA